MREKVEKECREGAIRGRKRYGRQAKREQDGLIKPRDFKIGTDFESALIQIYIVGFHLFCFVLTTFSHYNQTTVGCHTLRYDWN